MAFFSLSFIIMREVIEKYRTINYYERSFRIMIRDYDYYSRNIQYRHSNVQYFSYSLTNYLLYVYNTYGKMEASKPK